MTIFEMSVSAGELIAEGVGFSIQSADADFDNGDDGLEGSGELLGYSEVIDHTYRSGDGRTEPEHEGLVDTADLADDALAFIEPGGAEQDPTCHTLFREYPESWMNGRWAHVRDAHFAEMHSWELHSQPGRGDDARDYGVMHHGVHERAQRAERLMGWLRKQATAVRIARVKGRNKELARRKATLRRFKAELGRRYVASVKHCAKNETWWELYLTKAQRDRLFRGADRAAQK